MRRKRPGFTLLELMVVMWALGICLLMGGALIATTLKAERVGAVMSNRLSAQTALADLFRADVRRAEAAPDRLDDLTAGPNCLILRMPGGSWVVYHWQDGTLERIERKGQREARRTLVGPRGAVVEFSRSAGKATVITLRIDDEQRRGPSCRVDLSAALGGDLR